MAEFVPLEGTPTAKQLENFNAKIHIMPRKGCWIWTAAKKKSSQKECWYGVFRYNGRTVSAHRFSLFVILGTDPGPSVDHLCHNTLCVAPEHLRGGTIADNNWNRRCVISQFCGKGHERTAENTVIKTNGSRQCRICQQAAWRKTSKKKYEKHKAQQTHSSEMRDFARKPKLSFEIAEEIRSKYATGEFSQRVLAREYQVSQPMVGQILRNQAWSHDHTRDSALQR